MEKGALERIKNFNIQCMSQTQVNWTVEQLPELLEHVDSQASQIAALKEIAIQERNRYLVDFIHEYDDVLDCKAEARKQLEAEYGAMR